MTTNTSSYPFTLDTAAAILHNTNREVQLATGDPNPSGPWSEAEDWQIEATHASIRGAVDGGLTPEQEHERWVQEKVDAGWVYGPVKDAGAKTHPLLVPYAELSAEQVAKDQLRVAMIDALLPYIDPETLKV